MVVVLEIFSYLELKSCDKVSSSLTHFSLETQKG